MEKMTRRGLLGLGAAAGGAMLLPGFASGKGSGKPKKRPKNIIFCVSDGMSAGVLALANQLSERHYGKTTTWTKLLRDPRAVHGMCETSSLSSLVTDSAGASSAWGSGVKHWNRMLNTLPNGAETQPILSILREKAKMNTGLVTTASITHATPAGFTICHPSREEQDKIAEKYLKSGVQVFMGGGKRFFSADLIERFKKDGYAYSEGRSDLKNLKQGGKFLGLWADNQVPYEIDRVNDAQLLGKVPSLAEMAIAAIRALDGSSEGFMLQIEGARIDHAAHQNDIGGVLQDQIAFEEAVKIALDFAERDGETLVIVTSDHGNANPGLIGAGSEYFDSTSGLALIPKMKISYESLVPKIAGKSEGDMLDMIRELLGIGLSAEESKLMRMVADGTTPLKTIDQYQIIQSHLALATSNHTHVCWSGRQHSSDHTILTAIGPGAELFGGKVINTEFFQKILSLRGLKHQNPSLTYEEALKFKDKVAMIESEPHWIA
jgi:alkaline phosphatase